MSFFSIPTPIKQQINVYEKENIIENASGLVYLNSELSRIHIIRPINDFTLYVNTLNLHNKYIEKKSIINLICIIDTSYLSYSDSITMTFDPNFIWNHYQYNSININKKFIYLFNLVSTDFGKIFKISYQSNYNVFDKNINATKINTPSINSFKITNFDYFNNKYSLELITNTFKVNDESNNINHISTDWEIIDNSNNHIYIENNTTNLNTFIHNNFLFDQDYFIYFRYNSNNLSSNYGIFQCNYGLNNFDIEEIITPEIINEDFISDNIPFQTIEDGNAIYKSYNNFTINSGHIVTVSNRCKGLYLLINGNLIVNGTLSMTARGANCEGKYIYRDTINNNIIYSTKLITEIDNFQLISYPIGGVACTEINTVGNDGVNGACGGGGCGFIQNYTDCGLGSNGTSFSGGAGGGAVSGNLNIYSENGYINGGPGGTSGYHNSYTLGGGAGNPGGGGIGTNSFGRNGTGGSLILIVYGDIIIGNNGSIQANGSKGGTGRCGGGGSGGGSIHIFYSGTINNTSKITANGGLGGTYSGPESGLAGHAGYAGGNGTVNLVHLE